MDVYCLNFNKLQERYFLKTKKFLLIGDSKICVKLEKKNMTCRKVNIVKIGKKLYMGICCHFSDFEDRYLCLKFWGAKSGQIMETAYNRKDQILYCT